jgi:hypothetical protein
VLVATVLALALVSLLHPARAHAVGEPRPRRFKLLKHSGTVELTAKGTFTPKGATAGSATKTFQLKG